MTRYEGVKSTGERSVTPADVHVVTAVLYLNISYMNRTSTIVLAKEKQCCAF